MTDRLIVERLRVRVSGVTPDAAAALGARLATQLAQRLQSLDVRPAGLVRVRVYGAAPSDPSSVDGMARQVAAAAVAGDRR